VRSFGVELANEGIEAVLLLQAVHAQRAGCFLFEGGILPRHKRRSAAEKSPIIFPQLNADLSHRLQCYRDRDYLGS
jgi:hypothetical protein